METHSIINEHISKNVFSGFSLTIHLKDQLGMPKGYDEKINNKEVFLWISEGGEREDKDLRPLNHFHNPITNRGLTAFDYSAFSWATLPAGTQSPESYSWNDVRACYYNALTYKDKFSRDMNYARTFRGIGQIMHLVQDMSVPAHTRNDAHLSFLDFGGDDYELWAKINIKDPEQLNTYSVSYFGKNDYSFLIPNLFDTDQFTGANPDITIQPAIGLAEYTNANFLSADTIFTDFSHPAYSYMIERIEPDSVSGKDILYLEKTGIGENVDYFAKATNFYNYLPANYKLLALTTNDAKVHRSYAAHLMPRAIGYSAQALSCFFRGKLDATVSQNSIKVKNSSNETMIGGQFELYYDNSGDERNLLVTSEVAELISGAEQTFSFTPPQDVKSYMLVYRGTLGNEASAVIGKYIPNGEYVVITVNLVSNPYISGEALTKSVSMVWNPAGNNLERAPVDSTDSGFQQWYQSRTVVGTNMFGSRIDCGTKILGNREPGTNDSPIGSQPAGCPELTAGMEDVLYNNGYWYLAFEYAGSSYNGYVIDSGFDFKAARNFDDYTLLYPQSYFYTVDLPQSPVLTTGFRVRRTLARTGNRGWYGTPPAIGDRADESILWEDRYYGPLGLMGGFNGNENKMWPWMSGIGDYSDAKYFIPQWKKNCFSNANYPIGYDVMYDLSSDLKRPGSTRFWTEHDAYMSSRTWFHSSLGGQYSSRVITNICLAQYVPYTLDLFWDEFGQGNHRRSLIPDEQRTILVQAQALDIPQGTAGYNWSAAGRNAALEAQIIAALNMVYALNNIPVNEIREAAVSINIVK